MGSIIAEGITVLNYVINNKVVLFFGKGFGGGIPDLYGYLAPWAGASGYAFHDLARNDYFKMHLPIYEVIIKAGILGWSFFLFILIKNFVLRNKYAFISFLLFFMVFYVSKEYLLLTILFLKLAETNSKPYIIKLNDRKLILTS